MSKVTGIPKEELGVVQGYSDWGPDFYVYHKGKLVAIVEVKTTILSDRYPGYSEGCLHDAKEELRKYFTRGEWREHFGNVEYGVGVAIYLRDLDKIIETEFKEGVEYTIDIIRNPNYGP